MQYKNQTYRLRFSLFLPVFRHISGNFDSVPSTHSVLRENFEKVTEHFKFFSLPNYVHIEKQLLMKSKYN